MTYILLTGMPGSGKEEFLNVARKKGYDIVRMGDVVRELSKKNDIPMTDSGVGTFAHNERERHHYGIWADRTLSRVEEENTIIDGVRNLEEVEIFKAELGEEMQIVAVHVSPETRFQRLQKRNREDAPQTWEEFKERDERELDWGLGRLIAKADVMMINEGTLSEFHDEVEEFLRSMS